MIGSFESVSLFSASDDLSNQRLRIELLRQRDTGQLRRLLDADQVSPVEGPAVVVLKHIAATGVAARLEQGPQAALRVVAANGFDGLPHRRWMMSEIIDDNDAVYLAQHILTAFDTLKGEQRFLHSIRGNANLGRNRKHGQGIEQIVAPGSLETMVRSFASGSR